MKYTPDTKAGAYKSNLVAVTIMMGGGAILAVIGVAILMDQALPSALGFLIGRYFVAMLALLLGTSFVIIALGVLYERYSTRTPTLTTTRRC